MTSKKSIKDPISRRNFLTISATVPAVVVAQSLGTGAFSAAAQSADSTPKRIEVPSQTPEVTNLQKYTVGLELYSVRTELGHDLPKTLTAVSKMGYEAVEFYAPYAIWSIPQAKDIKSLMDDLGLRCYSTHNNGVPTFTPGDAMAKAIELNQILGSRLLVLASAPAMGVDGWKELCGKLTTAVDILKQHGLAAGFHNHQTEWAPLDGTMRTMDIIAANTPADFVLQLDVGTCVAAGADPVAWIKANPGRIKTIHLKDWAPGDNAQEKGYRVLFGEGVCPWKEIIAAEESVGGVEHYLIEQEGSRYPELESVQRCLENWKKMRAEG